MQISDQEYIRFLCFLLEFIVENMFFPGKVENWVSLANMGKQGMTKLPISSLRNISKILQANFRCRLGVSYIINPPPSVYIM